ncbi:MAG: hypothetical protein JO227_04400, partial [Acetobacteraceae bacterium]|nr:hypothetical protein [Acetobacteraceae bacterium]
LDDVEDAASKLERDHEGTTAQLRQLAEHLLFETGTAKLVGFVHQGRTRVELARRKILAAQAIDLWSERIFRPDDVRAPLSEQHLEAKRLLRRHGRINTNVEFGLALPRLPRWARLLDPDITPAAEYPETGPDPINQLFRHLLHVPPMLRANDPDLAGGRDRLVSITYKISDEGRIRPAPLLDEELRVGYAPLAELIDDFAIEILEGDEKHWYEVSPACFQERITAVLHALCKQDCHLIFFPEVTIRESDLPHLEQAIRDAATPTSPCLVVAGIAGSSSFCPEGRWSRNEVILLDHNGEEIGKQSKISRWNMSPWVQKRYGIQGPADVELFENIHPGDLIRVFELPGLGRIAVLICADMSLDEPGDWVRRNMMLDWTFTPILDGPLTTDTKKWIFARGRRASEMGRSRVVVVNSMSFTHRQNKQNATSEVGKKLITDECGIALLFDGRGAVTRKRLIQHKISEVHCSGSQLWNSASW